MDSNTMRTIIFGLALVVVSEAYQAGAPTGVCDTLTPQHGVDPQTTEFPYSFTAVKGKTQILITLSVKTATDSFKGFIIQVRDKTGKPIGTFNAPTNTKFIDCAPGKKNALTHNSSAEKKEIKATWTAPTNFSGSVTPIVTVVRDGATFWVGQTSANVNIEASQRRH